MPEDDCIFPGLKGIESVAYAGELSGLPRLDALRRAHEVLDYVGVWARGALSRGADVLDRHAPEAEAGPGDRARPAARAAGRADQRPRPAGAQAHAASSCAGCSTAPGYERRPLDAHPPRRGGDLRFGRDPGPAASCSCTTRSRTSAGRRTRASRWASSAPEPDVRRGSCAARGARWERGPRRRAARLRRAARPPRRMALEVARATGVLVRRIESGRNTLEADLSRSRSGRDR